MIGVVGRWLGSFILNGSEICTTDQFKKFKIEETAGNTLPNFEFEINTPNERLLMYLNEKNIINASLGVDNLAMTNMQLRPLKKEIARADGNNLNINVKGMLDKIQYLTNVGVKATPKQSAIQTLKEVVGKHFKTDFDVLTSQDKMNYLQHGITDTAFVKKLWMHANLGDKNFPMTAIEADGTYRLRDAESLKNGTPQWDFSIFGTSENSIRYNSDYRIVSNTGMMNYWAGYSKPSQVIDIDSGIGDIINSILSGVSSMGSSFEMSGDVVSSISENIFKTANMDDKFHQSAKNNMANLAVGSSTTLTLTVSNRFFPIRVLDLAMFKDDINTANGLGAIEAYSGVWTVTGVTRIIENWKLLTVVTMVRESMNSVQGTN